MDCSHFTKQTCIVTVRQQVHVAHSYTQDAHTQCAVCSLNYNDNHPLQ